MTILWSSYDHLMIILWSSYDHLMIIFWSSYDYLMTIIWSSCNDLMIALQSAYYHHLIILRSENHHINNLRSIQQSSYNHLAIIIRSSNYDFKVILWAGVFYHWKAYIKEARPLHDWVPLSNPWPLQVLFRIYDWVWQECPIIGWYRLNASFCTVKLLQNIKNDCKIISICLMNPSKGWTMMIQ